MSDPGAIHLYWTRHATRRLEQRHHLHPTQIDTELRERIARVATDCEPRASHHRRFTIRGYLQVVCECCRPCVFRVVTVRPLITRER